MTREPAIPEVPDLREFLDAISQVIESFHVTLMALTESVQALLERDGAGPVTDLDRLLAMFRVRGIPFRHGMLASDDQGDWTMAADTTFANEIVAGPASFVFDDEGRIRAIRETR